MSLSTLIRNQGNANFHSAGSCTSLGKARELYEQALSCYYRAKERATNAEEGSSAAKNIGKAAWKIAGVLVKSSEKPNTVIFYLHEAVKGLCSAFNLSEQCKSPEWRSEVVGTLMGCLQEVLEAASTFEDVDSKIDQLEKLVSITSVDKAAADLNLRLANLYFQDGATRLQNGDYKKCLSRMKDCYRPIEEVKRLSSSAGELEDLLIESELLEQDVFYHTSAASSIQARAQGDQLLSIALEEHEHLDLDLVFDIVDWYKQAIVLAREVEIEQEAIAESQLGVLYDKVLKMKWRAKVYFTHSFQLAESLKPRVFTSEAWYKNCTATLQRYQTESRVQEEEENRKAKEKFRDELKDVLADIKAEDTTAIDLIKHLYNNYPPKDPSWQKPSDDEMEKWRGLESEYKKRVRDSSKAYKKVLIKALAVYHPDKIDEKLYGMKWKVLCEEISKMLNYHYETAKSV